ncbi:hypothetical protein POL68_38275 [Stigmatella sp. ncwal1]|uniref:Cytochrome c domain-containing protein n=1 Tax=Stigmatella ashevillensis TaxID=2995309 RepID=A0ABT5DMI8_9BACT|nr:hypothetical protein [Stigmatella ashevillena]MDC0714365.1 hypothetical protein [Stigmatella ashevillena]
MEGTTQNSDEFIWQLFAAFTAPMSAVNPSPVVFETWASDADTFSKTPAWPDPAAPKKFQTSRLLAVRAHLRSPIDVGCATPGNAAVGGFPTAGTPSPCIAEEVKRNRAMFDYIVSNALNTQEGLKTAFQKSITIDMPTPSIAVKGDWVPLPTLLQWLPALGSVDRIRKLYYTNTSGSTEYALVSLHVASRQNPNWVWGTFEHQMTPGRCDDLGCFDTFGATAPAVPPARNGVNTQYGACEKTPALKAIMAQSKLSAVWQNYCLKSTQVDYLAADGTPYALGNSVIERIVGNGTVAASSCIGCHAYASFSATGAPTDAAKAMLPYNPMGPPIPAVLEGSQTFSFMWGVLLAP